MKKFIVLCVLLAACQEAPSETPVKTVTAPNEDLRFVGGYRSTDDDCQLTGETSFTVNYLDDAADLVSCPSGSDAAQSLVDMYNARYLAETGGYSLYTVPRR